MVNFSIIEESGFVWSRGNTAGMFIVSLLSIILSIAVLFTAVLLPYARKKTSICIVYYIAISDLLTSLGS